MAKRGSPRNPGGSLPTSGSAAPQIPDKLYFRIGEVADLCGVPAYVLRFWQTEFPQLRPTKSGTGQRLYRRRDVDTALRIRGLLYEDGYTIAGAKAILEAEALPAILRPPAPAPPEHTTAPTSDRKADVLRTELRAELEAILLLLGGTPPAAPSADGTRQA